MVQQALTEIKRVGYLPNPFSTRKDHPMNKRSHIIKIKPSECHGYHVVNEDGMVWRTEIPKDEVPHKYKYKASIPDSRIDHCSFESFGWHHASADTIDELIEAIKSFDVPYYSQDTFLNELRIKDAKDTRDDRQIELHWDGRGTTITRGEYNLNNMTAYTSL